jgi:hypothetical protein
MPAFATKQELDAFITEAMHAAYGYRTQLAQIVGKCECYFEGIQYIQAIGFDRFVNTTTGRLLARWNPDLPSLRVTHNHVTEKVTVASAATYPTAFDAQIEPPIRDHGVGAAVVAQTLEDTLSATVKHSNLLEVAQDANLRRCIAGTYGIGLGIRQYSRPVNMGGQTVQVPSKEIFAFDIHPTRFILDPYLTSRDLRQHNYVIYYDVWTIDKLRAMYPDVQWDPDSMSTVGQLTPYEQSISTLSNARLFEKYRTFSTTKGAIVYQIHRKDETGRFGEYYIVVKTRDKDINWINEGDTSTPFGGDGLPFVLLHGNRRANSMWSIGDVSMIMDSQDMLNLTYTMIFRHLQKYVSPQYIVDRRWFGINGSKEDFRNQFTNQVGGLIVGSPSSMDKSIMPPQLMSGTPPQPALFELIDRSSMKMRNDTFRTEMNVGGGAKSHVPFQTTNLLLNEGDRVLGIRTTEDIKAYEQLLGVALGTQIKHVQEQSAGTLAMLSSEGFDEQDITILLQTDVYEPTAKLQLDEASVRYTSSTERRQTLTAALSAQAISPAAYVRGMAELDQALTEEDRYMRQEIEKAVNRCVMGEPWQPMPLGQYNDWCLSVLTRAQFDRRIVFDPESKMRIAQAIQAQQQMQVQEKLAADPAFQVQQMQQQQQAEMQQQQQQQQPQVTLADILAGVGG